MSTLKKSNTPTPHFHLYGGSRVVRITTNPEKWHSVGSKIWMVVHVGTKRTVGLSDEKLSHLVEAAKDYWTAFDKDLKSRKLDYSFVFDIGRRKYRPFIGLLKHSSPDQLLNEIGFENTTSDAISGDWHKVSGELNLALSAVHRDKLLHE